MIFAIVAPLLGEQRGAQLGEVRWQLAGAPVALEDAIGESLKAFASTPSVYSWPS